MYEELIGQNYFWVGCKLSLFWDNCDLMLIYYILVGDLIDLVFVVVKE